MLKKRLETLDALRGLAVLAVVLYHYTTRYYQIYPQENQIPFDFYNGKYGVQLFFIISGFVIFMSLTRINKPIEFIVHRFIRLYPTFWFSVLFTFTMVLIFGLPEREVSLMDMIFNLSMIQGQFMIPSVDGVYWTLLYELKFYFWIFIIYSFKYLKNIELITLYFLLFILLSILSGFNEFLLYKVLSQIFIFEYMSYFISGIMFYKIFNSDQIFKTYLVLILAFIVGYMSNNYDNSYMLFVVYGIFILLSLYKLTWIAQKPFIFLGSISYALYLVHQNIGYIVLNFTFSVGLSSLIGTIIAIIISLILATFITKYVEKTSMKYLKNLYKVNEVKVLSYLNSKKFLIMLARDR